MMEPAPDFSPDPQPSFRHIALSSATTHIRLLTLHPGDSSSTLSASLTQHRLGSDLKYEALSYMWGPTEPKQPLHLNEQTFYLRPNIHAFLLRLRHPVKSRTLWLDAVCIDQNNIAERSAQVSLMRKIYKTCQQCLVWLGEAVPRGDEVIDLFAANPVDSAGMTDLNNLIRLLYRDGLADAFRSLLLLPYFSRVWMIQETTLASTVIVQVGQSTCLLDNIPTQVRSLMFEVFTSNHALYRDWLRPFHDFDNAYQVHDLEAEGDISADISVSHDLHPLLISREPHSRQHPMIKLGFKRSDKHLRWRPVVVDVHISDQKNSMEINLLSTVSLSTVSDLSFSADDFDPLRAFQSIECAFWSIDRTLSEQLLDERRRYINTSDQQPSTLDFRNYLEHADRWYCTDIRDRVFGALGVFTVWPQVSPFHADYSLSPAELLLCLIDYCRPTDPFKLGIRLLSALSINIVEEERQLRESQQYPPVPKHRSLTLMSRIDWAVQQFHRQLLPEFQDHGLTATLLHRSDVLDQTQTFLYMTMCDCPIEPADILVSVGDAAVVLGVRVATSTRAGEETVKVVGLGFDIQFTTDCPNTHPAGDKCSVPAHRFDLFSIVALRPVAQMSETRSAIDYLFLREMLQYLPQAIASKATPQDKSEDGTPVKWWFDCPLAWFWWLLAREQHVRGDAQPLNEPITESVLLDDSAGVVETSLSSRNCADQSSTGSQPAWSEGISSHHTS